jgi:hypothetical protein
MRLVMAGRCMAVVDTGSLVGMGRVSGEGVAGMGDEARNGLTL